jgi:hypothetical protein
VIVADIALDQGYGKIFAGSNRVQQVAIAAKIERSSTSELVLQLHVISASVLRGWKFTLALMRLSLVPNHI